ncbi:MAG TPA: aspartyl protease family protein [Thermoanaerobaculia bacterium]|nr:aspartyl protease family protein [Thermoanaerobaculia bacterium]
MSRRVAAAVFFIALSGCALYKEVSIEPLLLTPASIDRGADVQSMLRKADYLRAMELAALREAAKPTAAELAGYGSAYLAAGRFDDARRYLRAALDLNPFRNTYADIAWDLSQVELLSNNFESSLEWANIAASRGMNIRQWHLEYLKSLSGIPVYRFSGKNEERVSFRFGRPDVPRLNVRINRGEEVEAIVDSGAVLSIISTRLAESLPVRSLGAFEGTFFGLLGEPITVRFGILDTLELGGMVIENVPVAIMPDEKMRFLVNKKEGTQFNMNFLLGTSLLKEFRLELNFDTHHITFKQLTAPDRNPDPDQNLFFKGFRPHVRGAVNRKGWFLFVLDTGSEITFLNESRLAGLPVSIFGSQHTATLQGLGGSMKRGSKLADVQVGVDRWAGSFETIPMYAGNENDAAVGIIGQNFLGNFNVVIDFGRMRVDLQRR